VKLVDSHCHIDGEEFEPDRAAVIQRARDAGVERMVVIGSEAAVALAGAHEFIYATTGVHPHEASKANEQAFWRIEELLEDDNVVALGEIGLDYHYDFSPRDVQRDVFIRQLKMAQGRKPIVIHTREAWSDTLAILDEHWDGTGIFHCFTGGPKQAEDALARGFYVSFGGIVTFPKAQENREAACLTPDDRLLVETDAPYLAPVPFRGKRNEPAFVVETAKKLAEVRGTTPEHIAAVTTGNFERLCLRRSQATE
jgi:TatD DNase family protein